MTCALGYVLQFGLLFPHFIIFIINQVCNATVRDRRVNGQDKFVDQKKKERLFGLYFANFEKSIQEKDSE